MIDELLARVGNLHFSDFFVTALCRKASDKVPSNIEEFLIKKFQLIKEGASGRRFVYKNEGWYVFFTFFPTNVVVDEKYALKNMPLMFVTRCSNL